MEELQQSHMDYFGVKRKGDCEIIIIQFYAEREQPGPGAAVAMALFLLLLVALHRAAPTSCGSTRRIRQNLK